MDVGYIEGGTGFMEAMSLAIFRKNIFHIQPWCGREIAEGVFILISIQAA